jgi:protein phosphatase
VTVLVISDVHANAPALDAVLDAAEFDELLFLGDAVDVGPMPSAVVSTLADCSGTFVMGNHDRATLHVEAPVEGGRDRWQLWTRNRLSADHLRFLESLSNATRVRRQGLDLRLHHGNFAVPADPGREGREWPSRIDGDADRWVYETLARRFPEPYVLHGHSHIPYVKAVDGTTFVNPGTVGLQRPGRQQNRANYALIEDGEIGLHAVEYDIEPTCEAMLSLPLPDEFREEWAHRYRTGERA